MIAFNSHLSTFCSFLSISFMEFLFFCRHFILRLPFHISRARYVCTVRASSLFFLSFRRLLVRERLEQCSISDNFSVISHFYVFALYHSCMRSLISLYFVFSTPFRFLSHFLLQCPVPLWPSSVKLIVEKAKLMRNKKENRNGKELNGKTEQEEEKKKYKRKRFFRFSFFFLSVPCGMRRRSKFSRERKYEFHDGARFFGWTNMSFIRIITLSNTKEKFMY